MNNIIGLYRRRMMMSALGSGIDVAALSITYTGAHTDYGMVTMSDGARYRLLAFTSSGTLSIEQPVNCEVCVVGGGANGSSDGYSGGAGAYLKNQDIAEYSGGYVMIGAAQAASSVGEISVDAVSSSKGGTGGGAGGRGRGVITGDGMSKYPFGDTDYMLWNGKPHCGGGGGGSYAKWDNNMTRYYYTSGADGGSNGSNGSYSTDSTNRGGAGGSYGGGAGGISYDKGKAATYYGSGGGGGGYDEYPTHTGGYAGGSGYQGIVYMRIPEEQAA